jgi:hypothetical protein
MNTSHTIARLVATAVAIFANPAIGQDSQRERSLSGARFFATHTYHCYQLTGDEALKDIARENATLTLQGGGYTSAEASEAIDELFAELDMAPLPASVTEEMGEGIQERRLHSSP